MRVCMYTSEADIHKPGTMEEACEYGLPRGTCFVARRLEVVAVAGRLWISWCVLSWADFYRGLCSLLKRPFFAFRQKSLFFSPGCAQGAIFLLVCLCVCQCVCNIRRFY